LGPRKFGYGFEAHKALQSMRSEASGGKMPRFRTFADGSARSGARFGSNRPQKKMHHAETFRLLISGTLGPVA
jgi:hypothetical protein